MYRPFRSARRRPAAALACTALVCSAALAAAALAPAASLAAASAAPATAGPPPCATAGLVIWLTEGGAAAGSAFYTLNFTNLSGHACTLRGHPAVWAVSLSDRQQGSPAAQAQPRERTVTLANDATGYALLQYSDVVTGGGGPRPCHPVIAAGLRVRPPGQSAAKTVPIPLTACTTAGLVYMTVRPVQKTAPPS